MGDRGFVGDAAFCAAWCDDEGRLGAEGSARPKCSLTHSRSWRAICRPMLSLFVFISKAISASSSVSHRLAQMVCKTPRSPICEPVVDPSAAGKMAGMGFVRNTGLPDRWEMLMRLGI